MQTPTERRRALFWRTTRYMVTVLAVISLTALLFFIMLGYRFNRDNGTIQQGGLVQFISQPSGAKITVGEAQLANPTRSKITLNPGDYLVKLERTGYDLWQKNITVRAGTVLWLDSARLVPTSRTSESMESFSVLNSTLVSESGKLMAFLADKSKPAFSFASLTDADKVELAPVTIPSSLIAQKKGVKNTYVLVEWSRNDRHIIVRHDYGKQREFLLVDTSNPENTTAIRPVSSTEPVEVMFDPRSATDLIVRYKDGSVRQVTSGVVSSPILKNVATMATAKGSLVLYSTLPEGKITKTGYLTLGQSKPKELAAYSTRSRIQLALGEYYYDDYLTTVIGNSVAIEKIPDFPRSDEGRLLEKTVIARFRLENTPIEVSMHNRSRLVAFSASRHMTTYDLELNKKSEVPIRGKQTLSRPQQWLDNQHFWSDGSSMLRQYEYDGSNQADIVKVAPGFSTAYTQSGKYLYSIAKVDKGYALQRTKMILD